VSDDLNTARNAYRIVVDGAVGESWLDWFGDIVLVETAERSVLLATVPDQAALRGILDRLWDLNLALVSVTLLADSPVPPVVE
jgi:hypothetical protein